MYECDIERNDDGTRTVQVKMTLTAPGCGMGEILVQDVKDKLELIPTLRKRRRARVRSAVEPVA